MHKQTIITQERLDASNRSRPPLQEADLPTDRLNVSVRLCNLPPLHTIATQVLSLSADPDIDLKRIAATIEMDPAFAAEVLYLANSSLFGFTSRMHVLSHAVAILGLEHIKALSITVAMRSFLGSGNPFVRPCWRHSAACAFICERIASAFHMPPGQAYTAGLMHDIGRLGLLKTYPQVVGPVLQTHFRNVEDVRRAERTALNVDHGTAGAWLMKSWALPAPLQEVARHHHEGFQKIDSELLLLVKTACLMANALGYSAVRYSGFPTYQEVRKSAPLRARDQVLPTEEALRTSIELKLKAFG